MVLDGNEGGPGLQGFYSSKGLAVLGTVMDGDCGIDVACQMLGLPQTLAQRAVLREEISDYLLARLSTPWMQELMGTLQEVDLADVRQILREPADAKWGDTAVAVAKRDTHPFRSGGGSRGGRPGHRRGGGIEAGRDQVGDQIQRP